MTAQRSTKQIKLYRQHLKQVKLEKLGCAFCAIDSKDKQFISQTKHLKVIHNIFPYSIWDNQTVRDHLMVVPKDHVHTLANLGHEALLELAKVISKYEREGYCIYARPSGSVLKSIPHQHTHLLKLSNRRIKALLYMFKPSFRLVIK